RPTPELSAFRFNRDRSRGAAFRRGCLWPSSNLRQIFGRERLPWTFRLPLRRGISLRQLRSAAAGGAPCRRDQRTTAAWAVGRARAPLRDHDQELALRDS